MTTVAFVLGVVRWLMFAAAVASTLSGAFSLKDFFHQWQEHARYQQTVQAAIQKGDAFAVQSIEPVAAPDITSWISWAGPLLMGLASLAVSQWVSNPALKEWLQKFLVMVNAQGPPVPVNDSVKVDVAVPQGTLVTLPEGSKPTQQPQSIFAHLEAICANVPPGGEILFEMTTSTGIRVSVSGKVVTP